MTDPTAANFGSAENAKALAGVWAALPIPWSDADRVDKGLVVELIRRYAAHGLHGVYTAGTDGELHVLDDRDHEDLADALAAGHAETGLAVQAGCSGPHTGSTLRRIGIAVDRGIPLVQVALPGWVSLDDAEVRGYFAAMSAAAPQTGIVHYNIAKAGRMLTGAQYRELSQVCPNLVGSKHTGGGVAELIEITQQSPSLHHFVVDLQIVPGAMFGAAGFYSFLANLSPWFVLDLWRACEHGDWARAAELRARGEAFLRSWRGIRPAIGSPALAKIATRAGLLPDIPLRVRAPYRSGAESDVLALRRLAEQEGFGVGSPTPRRP